MKKTFQQQMHHIVSAYHQGKLNPYCANHSFVGHLMDHKLWNSCHDLHTVEDDETAFAIETEADVRATKEAVHKESQGLYELGDLIRMERRFLDVFHGHLSRSAPAEDALYEAVVQTIVILKEIHEAHGETCYYEPVAKADYSAIREQRSSGLGFAIVTVSGPMSLGQILAQLFGGRSIEEDEKLKRHRDELRRRSQN